MSDFEERRQASIKAHLDYVKKVQDIANASLRCASKCPRINRRDCEGCDNLDCQLAELDLLELWRDK